MEQFTKQLGLGEASDVAGALGFSLCATFGRFGRAKLRPYIRRSTELRLGTNRQIEMANDCWLKILVNFSPREVPTFAERREVVVTYSDGEGVGAGLGIAPWSSKCKEGSLVAYCMIPESVRQLWDKQTQEEHRDIFLIEAIGPLVLLTTFPKLLRGTVWTHYIDNVGAEYALVKRSSSIRAGDVIVGETWRRIQELNVLPYFDRVASESNPTRGRRSGPWQRVVTARLRENLEEIEKHGVASGSDMDYCKCGVNLLTLAEFRILTLVCGVTLVIHEPYSSDGKA